MAASLGKKIKMLRTEKGLTQAELGELLNKSGSTVRMWELDRSQPSPQTIRLLCDVLGTTPNALLGKEENEEPVEMVSIDNNILGKRLRAARGNMSIREFAKKCNISPPKLEALENGTATEAGKPFTISFSALVDLSLGSGLSLDYLMGKDEPAFNDTPLEGMSQTQASLYLLTGLLELIDKEYPDMSAQQKATLISEFNKHDPVELMLSALKNEISNGEKGKGEK